MKKKDEMIIKLDVKLVYPVEKCFISILNLQLEMVFFFIILHYVIYVIIINIQFILKIILGIDDGDEAISSYVREEDEAEEKVEYRELDMDRLALEASEIDTSGITVAGADRLKNNKITNENSTGI